MSDAFKPVLLKLVNSPASFNADDTEKAIDLMASAPGVAPAQIGAFLTALKFSGLDRTSLVLSAAAKAMMRHAVPAPVEHPEELYVDIVGTGGDGHNTFNVSTSAAIVAAGAGARVVKVSYLSIIVANNLHMDVSNTRNSMEMSRRLQARALQIFSVRLDALCLPQPPISLSLPPRLRSYLRPTTIRPWRLLGPLAALCLSVPCSMCLGLS